MATFNYDEFVKNLPDAFRKDKDSNNYKLLQVEKHIYDKIHTAINSVYDILDIDNATGAVLDKYGERLHLKRGSIDDTQYRIRLKAKIAQNMCDGNRDSVAKALSYVLSSTTDKIQIKSGTKTGLVEIVDIPLKVIFEADFTVDEVIDILNSLFPQNVVVDEQNSSFSGTFEFGSTENEYDELKGFSDANGETGGFFGLLMS